MFKTVSKDTILLEKRNKQIKTPVAYQIGNEEYTVEKNIVNGEMEVMQLVKPLGEMVTHGSIRDLKDIVGKATLDVELGREETPVLYKPVYDEITDPAFPQLIDAKWALSGQCVFLEHMEGGEVKFGSLAAEKSPTARINTYTTGFEVTQEVVDFNQNYKLEMFTKSIGESYNALLNHIHFSPIIEFDYKAANTTKKVEAGEGLPLWVGIYNTLREAVKDARTAKRPGTVLLANSADQMDIEQALRGGHTINGTTQPAIAGVNTVIYYDGEEFEVGKKKYEYKGVKAGEAYLIRPKKGFKELIKRDLTTMVDNKDISRLVENQIVSYAYRGVFAAVEENIQKVQLY